MTLYLSLPGLTYPTLPWVQCSSLGSVNDSLLKSLYYACQGKQQSPHHLVMHAVTNCSGRIGDCGLRELEERTRSKGKSKSKDSATTADDAARIREHIRVYFPSKSTVVQSLGGKNVSNSLS
jgi:hypothetical protein